MDNKKIVSVREICTHYNIEATFVNSLRDYGLIQVIEEAEDTFVQEETLSEIEKIMHLHYDLQINLEGIDAISHLLTRVKDLQREVNSLRNRLY